MSTLNGGPGIITDGLVLYLDAANPYSYVSGSTIWNDISRGGNNGTISSGSYTNNNSGILTFNGTDGKVLFSSYNFPVNYTKVAFINTIDTSTRNILSSNTPVDHAFWLINGNISAGHNVSYFVVQTPITTNTWNHVAVSFDNSTGTMKLYLNGVLKASNTAPLISTGGTYKIGEHSTNQSFNGPISSVLLYDRVLSDTEVLQNYNTQTIRFVL